MLEQRPRWRDEQLVERHQSAARVRRILRGSPLNMRAENETERLGRGDVDRLVQRGDRQRLPQQLDQPWGLPVRARATGERSSGGRRAPVRSQCPRRAGTARPDRASRAQSSATARRRGAAAPAAADRRAALRRPSRSTMPTRSVGCSRTPDSAPIRRRNRNVSYVAAEQDVLTVVHALAGDRIGERRRAAAERPAAPRARSTPMPRSASAVAALRPATPAPMTTTSRTCICTPGPTTRGTAVEGDRPTGQEDPAYEHAEPGLSGASA